MASWDDRLHEVLDGYAKFLREKELALAKHQPYLVRWVREFLLFAREHGGYTFEQTLDLFLAEVGGRVGTKPWQLQQASDAVRIYRYRSRTSGSKKLDTIGGGQSRPPQPVVQEGAAARSRIGARMSPPWPQELLAVPT